MKLSFHSWAYGSMFSRIPSYPLDETIKRVAMIGYQGIEIGAARPHAWPPDLASEDRLNIKKLLARYELEVAAICPNNENLNPASPIKQERLEAIEHYRDCVKLAADLKSPVVVFIPGWRIYGTTFSQAWKWSVEALKSTLELAEKLNVFVAIEPVNSFRTNLVIRSDQALAMRDEVKSTRAKLLLDTIHVWLEKENPVDVVNAYGQNLVHIHCVDAVHGLYERKIPGQGEFGFKSFIAALRKIGYQGYLSVEVWGISPDEIAQQSYAFLNPMVDSYSSGREK